MLFKIQCICFFFQAADKWKSTPMHAACTHGSIKTFKLLVKSGAKVQSLNEANNTPLHLACSGGHEEVYLLYSFPQ